MDTPKHEILFSIIVPVYNRPDEVADLLVSLAAQTDRGFEIILVEDGSTVPCRPQAEAYKSRMRLKYYYKDNEGRSIARNYGIVRADGDFLVFVDS
ncbi:MAG: glycosyltransferase family 2 protein, partial [Muribaculaceae bacterium]|nr:glycosyltransferase family 2 protein [Muribaculaceae bacterium]